MLCGADEAWGQAVGVDCGEMVCHSRYCNVATTDFTVAHQARPLSLDLMKICNSLI